MSQTMAVSIVIIVLGAVVGLLMEKASINLINKRVNDLMIIRFSGSNAKTLMWAIINSLSWFFVVWINGLHANTIECILLISVSIILSAVDITIKKIPNELILLTLIIGATFTVIDKQLGSISINLIGFAVGFILFLIPAFIGKGAGWGDVKYAAVVGFCLGVYGFLTAIICMALILLVYTAYLIHTGKGNLKTKIALGPFMASGFISVLFLNIINSRFMLFDLGMFLNR